MATATISSSSVGAVAALVIFVLVTAATMVLVLVPVTIPVPQRLRQLLVRMQQHQLLWRQRRRRRSSGRVHTAPATTRCCATLQPRHQQRLRVSFSVAPVAGVALMLATGALNGPSLASGIVGDERMQPFGIVLLFMGLAFQSAALDQTGCFQWVALRITHASRGSGRTLFLLYTALAAGLTIFTSNDIAIMTLTPIIYYCARATAADPTPFLTAAFTASNLWSMLLFVGNPTNVIVAQSFQLSFLGYSVWMALPTLAGSLLGLAAVAAVHWRAIPRTLTLPAVQPAAMLADVPGAALGSANIIACLALLAAAPSLHWPLWAICLACAGLHALYNWVAYVLCRHRWCRTRPPSAAAAAAAAAAASVQQDQALPAAAPPLGGSSSSSSSSSSVHTSSSQTMAGSAGKSLELVQQQQQPSKAAAAAAAAKALAAEAEASSARLACSRSGASLDAQVDVDEELPAVGAACSSSSSDGALPLSLVQGVGLAPPPLPTFWRPVLGLPWEVVPFTLGMFCCVEALVSHGWADRLAGWLAGGLQGVWPTTLAMGVFSIAACCLLNNQPATILLTRVIGSPAFAAGVGPRAQSAAALALVVASNTGALFSVYGALAGVVFIDLLNARGFRMTYARFSWLMLPAGIVSTLAALVVLCGEATSSVWR